MFNHNKTYLTFQRSKEPNYNFTGTVDTCDLCVDVDNKTVLIFGKSLFSEYNNWKKICKDHLKDCMCKPQHCNSCNVKAKININPKICVECAMKLLNNYDEMTAFMGYD